MSFDPNDIGVANGNYFALPVEIEDAEIVLISVPWDATVSYMAGTAKGPEAMIEASTQIDLFDINVPNAWEVKIGTLQVDPTIEELNTSARESAELVISSLENGESGERVAESAAKVNLASASLNEIVYEQCKEWIQKGKLVGIVGGEHSVPLGAMKAVGEKYDNFGVLHIDAHCDLREAYEGFTYSHASIMYNALKEIPNITKIVQVAVRDFCDNEYRLIQRERRVEAFFDNDIKKSIFEGLTWSSICDRIIDALPNNIYISLDIDGLNREFCPSTGTPVPGGIDFSQVDYLLHRIAVSNKKIIGFDLCEVAPSGDDEWDANVGARILYKLSLYSHLNNR
jgi:agmatinase